MSVLEISKDVRRLEYLVLSMLCIGFGALLTAYLTTKSALVFLAGFPYIVAVARVYDRKRTKTMRKYRNAYSNARVRFVFNSTELAVSVFVAFWFGVLFGLFVGVILP